MDDIQRKLEQIDRELAGPVDIHRRITDTAPLVFAVLGLIIGILAGDIFSGSPAFWIVLLLLLSTASAAVYFRGRYRRDTEVFAYLALGCFICLGAIRINSFYQPRSGDIRNLVKDNRELAQIRGLIVSKPYTNKNKDWAFAKFTFTDPASSFYLKVKEVETNEGWVEAAGTVRVQVGEPLLDLNSGDYIQAHCWLDRFEKPTNPGQFDIKNYLSSKGVFVGAYVKGRSGITLLKRNSESSFWAIRNKLRNLASEGLFSEDVIEEGNHGLLEALLLGYRGNIEGRVYRAFQQTGLLHFISLSGLHLGILIGIIWWLCKTIGLSKPGRAFVCIIALIIFLLIVPARPPTVRAAIIGFVFCLSFLFRRKANSFNSLSLAAIILLLIRPSQLFEAGWQLSFASVLGILLFCRRTHLFLYEKITGLPWKIKGIKSRPFFRIVSRPGPYILALFTTGLTAWLGSAGILLYHFYTICPFASIWTVIAFPLVGLILIFGYLKILLSFLLPSAAMVVGVFVNGLSDFLIWLVAGIASLDISEILIGHISIYFVIFYYLFLFFAGYGYFPRPILKKVICVLLASGMILFLAGTKLRRTYPDDLTVTALDVGHGQAIVAQLPGGENILFDAGSLHHSNIGSRIVAPFLNYSGINKIDAILISHSDIDHINGIPEIVENCEIGRIYANEYSFGEEDKWGTAGFLKEELWKKGFEIEATGESLELESKARVEILWPEERITKGLSSSDNDRSVVSLIEYGGVGILLCSDIEKFAQGKLLELYPELEPEVVVVPHHGSLRTLDEGFLKAVGGSIFICSCGLNNYEKLEAEGKDRGGQWLYTFRDGAITIHINKEGRKEAPPRPASQRAL